MGRWLPLQVALAVPPFLYAWRESKKGTMTQLGYCDMQTVRRASTWLFRRRLGTRSPGETDGKIDSSR